MLSSRTIESIISGPRQSTYVPLFQSVSGIVHKPECALAEAYQQIWRSEKFNEMMSRLRIPGSPIYDAKLTEEEATAILLYTFKTSNENTSFSATINRALCARSDVIRELRGFLLHMLSGLRKLKQLPPRTPAYHAIPAGNVPLDTLGYVKGRTVMWPSFTSVTPDVAFITAVSKPGAVVFEVGGEGAIAYDITPFATTGTECQMNEFLLEPDTKFRVESIEANSPAFNGATLVRLCSSGVECARSPILSTIIEEFRAGASRGSERSCVPLSINASKMRFTPERESLPEISSLFATMPSMSYTSLSNAVISAEFCEGKTKEEKEANAKELLSHCRETLLHLKKKGVLERYKMTEEQAAAIIIFTFDYGSESSKMNPCYKVNKALGTRNSNEFHKMRPFILHLLSGLRKLPRVDTKIPLYRGINGAKIQPIENHYNVGMKRGWVAFTSTCYETDYAEDFTSGDFPVLFKITGDYIGYDITDFSIFNEPEVIIEPDMTFVVKEVTQDEDGVYCITLEVEHSEPIIVDIVKKFEYNSRTSQNTNTVLPPQLKQKKPDTQQPFMAGYQQQFQQFQQAQPQYAQQPQAQYGQQPQAQYGQQPQAQYGQQPQAQYGQQPQTQYVQQPQTQYVQQPQAQYVQQPQAQYGQQPQTQYVQQPQQQNQLQHDLMEFERTHIAHLISQFFSPSVSQKYSSIKTLCEDIYKGDVPLTNDSETFVKLTSTFLKISSQYKKDLYAHFSYAGPKVVEWQYTNFFSAYLMLSEALRNRLRPETYIEFCLTPGSFVTDESSAVKWTSDIQRKISLRYPSGSLILPADTRASIRKFTRSRIWFFMATNSKDPKGLINKIKSRPDFVSSCYFSARLYDPLSLIIIFKAQEISDPRSIFSRYGCKIDDSTSMCNLILGFMGSRNIAPLNIVRIVNGDQNNVSFRVTLSSPEDIPQVKRIFGDKLCECPIVNVELKDNGAEFLRVIGDSPNCAPLSIVPTPDKSLVVTFFDESNFREFCIRYKQKFTRLNEPAKKEKDLLTCSAPVQQIYPPASGNATEFMSPPKALEAPQSSGNRTINYPTAQKAPSDVSKQAYLPTLSQTNYQQRPQYNQSYSQQPPPPSNGYTQQGYQQAYQYQQGYQQYQQTTYSPQYQPQAYAQQPQQYQQQVYSQPTQQYQQQGYQQQQQTQQWYQPQRYQSPSPLPQQQQAYQPQGYPNQYRS